MAMEELKYFQEVGNIKEYIIKGIIQGTLTVDEVVKFARI